MRGVLDVACLHRRLVTLNCIAKWQLPTDLVVELPFCKSLKGDVDAVQRDGSYRQLVA